MKKYFKDLYGESTFVEVTVEEFENDMRRYKFSDFEAIDLAANRRVGTTGSLMNIPYFVEQGKVSVQEDDAEEVKFWDKYSNADICGSVKIKNFCDYYVVEINDATHH